VIEREKLFIIALFSTFLTTVGLAVRATQGGELVIEGKVQDVRYRPLEFNGWRLRHWTLPFEGERFSVVWFTPRGCEGRSLRDAAAAAAAASTE
jgi:hypothetical protein